MSVAWEDLSGRHRSGQLVSMLFRFGGDPAHEALTAYGLMQFMEMSKGLYFDISFDCISDAG